MKPILTTVALGALAACATAPGPTPSTTDQADARREQACHRDTYCEAIEPTERNRARIEEEMRKARQQEQRGRIGELR